MTKDLFNKNSVLSDSSVRRIVEKLNPLVDDGGAKIQAGMLFNAALGGGRIETISEVFKRALSITLNENNIPFDAQALEDRFNAALSERVINKDNDAWTFLGVPFALCQKIRSGASYQHATIFKSLMATDECRTQIIPALRVVLDTLIQQPSPVIAAPKPQNSIPVL